MLLNNLNYEIVDFSFFGTMNEKETFQRVEFPGIVKNGEKAVAILGGSHKIYEGLSQEQPQLEISFRPDDSLSHPIRSENEPDPAVLIRIKCIKKFQMDGDQKKLISVVFVPEYLGPILSTNSFNQPSDFQFLPPLSTSLNPPTVQNPPPQSFLYLPPPVFLHNYHYDSMYIQRRIFANQQYENAKIWKDNCPWIINQSELLALENGPRPPLPADDVTDELLNLFTSLFDERPIWTTLALFDRLNENIKENADVCNLSEQSAAVFHSIACVAYSIKNGPYILCWVRYGINPILRSDFSKFQSLVFSLKDWSYTDEMMKKAALSTDSKSRQVQKISQLPKGISKLSTVPNRLFFAIQLCDLHESFIENLLQTKEDHYSFQSGWYSMAQIDTVRKFAMLKLQRLITLPIDSTINPNIIMADIVSVDDLKKELDKDKEATEIFDFEFLNAARNIFGIDSFTEQETKEDLFNQFTEKAIFTDPTGRILTN